MPAPKPADMEDCSPKLRCTQGDYVGVAYDPADPCEEGQTFNVETCSCDPFEFCDCSCDNDCAECQICDEATGTCVPDPSCGGVCGNYRVEIWRRQEYDGGGYRVDGSNCNPIGDPVPASESEFLEYARERYRCGYRFVDRVMSVNSGACIYPNAPITQYNVGVLEEIVNEGDEWVYLTNFRDNGSAGQCCTGAYGAESRDWRYMKLYLDGELILEQGAPSAVVIDGNA